MWFLAFGFECWVLLVFVGLWGGGWFGALVSVHLLAF